MRLIIIVFWASANVSLAKFLKTLSSDHRRQRSLPLQVGEAQTRISMLPNGQALQTMMNLVSKVIAATLGTDIQEMARDQSEMGREVVIQDRELLRIGEA